ncbi:MAG TPA: DUF3396 domain-containing protein [Chitinophagaceae bacterium]|nr:DUF3396 domain-containing protein [Chitinophagaceae bacterium]
MEQPIKPASQENLTGSSNDVNIESLKREVVLKSGKYTFMRPGISIRLTYPTPIQELGKYIADIFEKYFDFIKPTALSTYLSGDGTWKKMSKKRLDKDLKELRNIPKHYEFVEYHYGHEAIASVGDYGIHFIGTNLGNERPPLEECLLLLEFPHNFFEKISVKHFIDFVTDIVEVHPFGSGIVGYSFKHLLMTFRGKAFDAIGELALRYIGFDINSDFAMSNSRRHIYNVSWLTLLGDAIMEELTGEQTLRGEQILRSMLPSSLQIHRIKTGLLIQAAPYPIIGNIEQGAKDALPLKHLAAITRQLRIRPTNLGPDISFNEPWLTRFDNLKLEDNI